MAETMWALSISGVTRGEESKLSEVPIPDVKPGWALVRMRGFGLNHSELELRRSEIRAGYIKKPIIPGIEGVGEVEDPGDTGFAVGTKVCMLMGGMGRSWDGSYAEWCLVPAARMFRIPDVACELPWATLAAIPIIQGAGMWANVMTTVSSRNMSEVPELIDLVGSLGVDVYAFGRYCPTSGQRVEEFHMEPHTYRALLVECQERIRRQKARCARTYFYPKDHLWRLLEWEQGEFVIPEGEDPHATHGGCHCGSGHLTILPTGAVHACRRMESPVGDVSRETLADIYCGSRLAEYRCIDRFEKFAGCPLHGWCRGCPAVAFGYTGDRYAPDPQCWYGLV